VSIDGFSNPVEIYNYDFHTGTISQYENRLIVRNSFSIEELEILPNGQLNQISRIEQKINNTLFGFIEGDRYLNLSWDYDASSNVTVSVFDLSQIPMRWIKSFDSGAGILSRGRHFFYENNFFMVDDDNYETIFFDKNTFERKGVIHGLFGNFTVYDNKLLRLQYQFDPNGWELQILNIVDLYENNFEMISSLFLEGQQAVMDIKVENSILNLVFEDGVALIDIS